VDAYFWGDARTFYVIAFPIAVLVSVARLRGISLAFPESATLTTQLALWGGALHRAAAGLRWRSPRGVAAGLAALTAAFVLGRPIASLALANSGNMLREHGDLMPTGSSSQTVTYAVAHVQLAWSAGLEQGYGAAWQDLAEVALDERDASQAALYLARAAQEGQRDALVLRDDDRLSRLAIAQASPNLHAPH
jgi:hypothetical protein